MLLPSNGFLRLLVVFSSHFSLSGGRLTARHLHCFETSFSDMRFSYSSMALFAYSSVRHCSWSPLPSAAAVLTSDLTCQALPFDIIPSIAAPLTSFTPSAASSSVTSSSTRSTSRVASPAATFASSTSFYEGVDIFAFLRRVTLPASMVLSNPLDFSHSTHSEATDSPSERRLAFRCSRSLFQHTTEERFSIPRTDTTVMYAETLSTKELFLEV